MESTDLLQYIQILVCCCLPHPLYEITCLKFASLFFFYFNFGFFSIVVWMCQFETFGLANTFQDLFSQILPK